MTIRKETVQAIIALNDTIHVSTSMNRTNFSPEEFVWNEEQKQLAAIIERLSVNEQLDLIALMDYGRDGLHFCNATPNHSLYEEKRREIEKNHKLENPSGTAIYLMGKGQYLSRYLRYALPLFQDEQFVF